MIAMLSKRSTLRAPVSMDYPWIGRGLFLVCCLVIAVGQSQATIDVELGFISPTDPRLLELSTLGQELVSGFKLAVLNANRLSRLANSSIRISTNFSDIVIDEGISPSDNCSRAASNLHSRSKLVGVIGGFTYKCTSAVQDMLRSTGVDLAQVSYAATADALSDSRKNPTLFRACATDSNQAQALADIVRDFRWKRVSGKEIQFSSPVSIFASDDEYGRGLSTELRSRATEYSILVSKQVYFKATDKDIEIDDKLQILNHAGTRVNILIASGHGVFRVLKRAASRKMTGEGWVWLGTDRVASMQFNKDQSMNHSAAGLVAVSPKLASGVKLLDVIMSWFYEPQSEFPGIVWTARTPMLSPYVIQVYDAVMLFHATLTKLAADGKIFTGMPMRVMRQVVFEELKSFDSFKNSIKTTAGDQFYFENATRSVPGSYDIVNYQDGQWKVVGSWDSSPQGLNIPNSKIIWPGGSTTTPTDRGTPGKPLFRIGLLAPIHPGLGTLSAYGIELVSACKVAVDIINNDKNHQVELDLKVNDEGLDGSLSCEQAAQELTGYNIAAVVGAYRSKCSVSAAKVLGLKNNQVPMVSYASPAEELSDKSKFKYFFRVGPSNKDEHIALEKIIEKYSFNEVGSIASSEMSSSHVQSSLVSMMRNASISVPEVLSFPTNSKGDAVRKSLQKLRSSGSRVNVMSMPPNDADVAYQQIKDLAMFGKGYVWLGTNGAAVTAFQTNKLLAKDMEGFVGLTPKTGEGSLYLKLLSTWLGKDSVQYPGIIHTLPEPNTMPGMAQVFDAINGIALALSDLVVKKSINHATPISDVRQRLYDRLKGYSSMVTGYPSATGLRSIYFDRNQNGPQVYDVMNLVDSKWRKVGSYLGSSSKLILNQDPLFPGRTTIPMVGGSKFFYKMAAVFPSSREDSQMASITRLQYEALLAVVKWVNSNISLNVGFEIEKYEEPTTYQECVSLHKNMSRDIAVVVSGCGSTCTRGLSAGTKVPILSYSAASAVLSHKKSYPTLFRTCASDIAQAEAVTFLVKHFQWKKVGVIVGKGTSGQALAQLVRGSLSAYDVEVTAAEEVDPTDSKDLSDHVTALKSAGAAVNFVISNSSHTTAILQEAFEQGMTGKGWTWITTSAATPAALSQSPNLQRSVQGMLSFSPRRGKGRLFDDILMQWNRRQDYVKRQLPYAAQIFNSVLAPTFALDRLHREKSIIERTTDEEKRSLLVRELKSMRDSTTGFQSATDNLFTFDANQDGPGDYDIVNLNGDKWIEVGTYRASQLHMIRNVVWSGRTVQTPSDEQPWQPGSTSPGSSSSSNKGLVALAVVFGVFGVLVLAFMVYIIHRVRYRHLYMQSDVANGGLFSVLYGHGANKQSHIARQHTNPSVKCEGDVMLPRHL